jgi:mRNA interferase MazF
MPFRCGDVVLVLFPDSNLRTAKRRPVLVVQADNLTTGLAQTIVLMITSNSRPRRAPEPRVGLLNRARGSADGTAQDRIWI